MCKSRLVSSFVLLFVCAAGCKSMTPGNLEFVQPVSDRPRAGNVYLLRGFIGIWSYGIDHLGKTVNDSGVRAYVYQEKQWDALCDAIVTRYSKAQVKEPLVLIGHSYGADDTLRIAKRLQQHDILIDLIVTLDPVTPPKVPPNVRLCYNIYQPNLLDGLPFFRGVPLEAEAKGNLQNVNIRSDRRDLLEPKTDHFNIEKNTRIHAEVVKKVHEFCPPRQVWAAQHQPFRYSAALKPLANPPAGKAESRAGSTRPPLDRVP